MSIYSITGSELKEMICFSAAFLEKNKKAIDSLNVFPVPDGDTGTNMSLTMRTAAKEVQALSKPDVETVAQSLARGSLKGARGNSGVILSQIFRGFSSKLAGLEEMNARDLVSALSAGVEAAYKAVMKPKEGTILTVATDMAKEGAKKITHNMSVLDALDFMIEKGEETLKRTPDMLQVLKDAGVVDAGGMGLIIIFRGFKMCLEGGGMPENEIADLGGIAKFEIQQETDIEFGYCTEYFVKVPQGGVDDTGISRLRDALCRIGDSVVVVGEDTLIKVHVHSNAPGKAIQYGMRFGELSGIKVENMREQHSNLVVEEVQPQTKPPKEIAVISVAVGEGIKNIFYDLGVDIIIEGGQTMNPCVADISKAIDDAPSNNVLIFPNNKNIIFAARQAAELSQKNVKVIPTKSVPEGISGLIAYNLDNSFEENINEINSAVKNVDSGVVTFAVRESKYDGFNISEGDILGLRNDDVVEVGSSVHEVSLKLLEHMVSSENDTITVFYGKDVTEADAKTMQKAMEDKFQDCEVQMYNGGQPLYYYIISVE